MAWGRALALMKKKEGMGRGWASCIRHLLNEWKNGALCHLSRPPASLKPHVALPREWSLAALLPTRPGRFRLGYSSRWCWLGQDAADKWAHLVLGLLPGDAASFVAMTQGRSSPGGSYHALCHGLQSGPQEVSRLRLVSPTQ